MGEAQIVRIDKDPANNHKRARRITDPLEEKNKINDILTNMEQSIKTSPIKRRYTKEELDSQERKLMRDDFDIKQTKPDKKKRSKPVDEEQRHSHIKPAEALNKKEQKEFLE